MRAMPTSNQATLNPNDLVGNRGGEGYQKKQFLQNNQHIFHHNAVLPYQTGEQPNIRNLSSGKEALANIPLKPNAMNYESASQLQK